MLSLEKGVLMRRAKQGTKLTLEEQVDLHRRVEAGETFEAAALAVGCSTKSIQRLVVRAGGMVLRSPHVRSSLRLSVEEREEIARGLQADESLRAIARRLHRATSTVSRDVTAGGGRRRYRVWRAEQRAKQLAKRPKTHKLAGEGPLPREVSKGLLQRWSPQQIAARLRQDFPAQPSMHVSHETIYRSLFVQARGALRKELTACLRTGRTCRRHQKRTHLRRGHMVDMVMLSERPPEVEDRAVPGHWEGDLIVGKAGRSALATLVERHSRYVMVLELSEGRTASAVRDALTRHIKRLPRQLCRSLTWDQGKEMAEHAKFTVDTDVQVFFCDPHSPWQRGSNENTNGLLRQYFPKGTDLSGVSQNTLDTVSSELNGRPRKTLAWRTPAEVFAHAVAVTG